jgi:hypothetical protein
MVPTSGWLRNSSPEPAPWKPNWATDPGTTLLSADRVTLCSCSTSTGSTHLCLFQALPAPTALCRCHPGGILEGPRCSPHVGRTTCCGCITCGHFSVFNLNSAIGCEQQRHCEDAKKERVQRGVGFTSQAQVSNFGEIASSASFSAFVSSCLRCSVAASRINIALPTAFGDFSFSAFQRFCFSPLLSVIP